jgi:hypothetical protein
MTKAIKQQMLLKEKSKTHSERAKGLLATWNYP